MQRPINRLISISNTKDSLSQRVFSEVIVAQPAHNRTAPKIAFFHNDFDFSRLMEMLDRNQTSAGYRNLGSMEFHNGNRLVHARFPIINHYLPEPHRFNFLDRCDAFVFVINEGESIEKVQEYFLKQLVNINPTYREQSFLLVSAENPISNAKMQEYNQLAQTLRCKGISVVNPKDGNNLYFTLGFIDEFVRTPELESSLQDEIDNQTKRHVSSHITGSFLELDKGARLAVMQACKFTPAQIEAFEKFNEKKFTVAQKDELKADLLKLIEQADTLEKLHLPAVLLKKYNLDLRKNRGLLRADEYRDTKSWGALLTAIDNKFDELSKRITQEVNPAFAEGIKENILGHKLQIQSILSVEPVEVLNKTLRG